MLASFAEYERGTIRERTQAGLHRALRNGTFLGRIPFGYRRAPDETSLTIVEEEARIVREIIANIAAGATLYSETKRLNNEGVPSPGYRFRGDERRRDTRLWTAASVGRIVHQAAYSGIHRVRVEGRGGQEEIIERPVPAIVEPSLRERAEAQLVKNKSRAGELRNNGRKYLLSGLVRCGICGQACSGRTSTAQVSGGTKKYAYYRCISNRPERSRSKAGEGSKPPHSVPNIPAEWLEGLVWADVRAFLANPGEVLERVREHMAGEDDYAELEERRNSLKKRLREVEGELDRLLNLYATGEIDAEWLTTHVRDRESRIENLKLLIVSVEADIASREQNRLAAEQTETWLRRLADNLAEVEGHSIEAFAKRRELVQLLVDRITADRDEDGRPRVHMTYRFGQPPEDAFVQSVRNSGPSEAAKILRRALSPPLPGTRKFGWA
jgi:site-specific DNA recombinase